MKSDFRNTLVVIIVICALVGFVVTSGIAIKDTLSRKLQIENTDSRAQSPTDPGSAVVYLSSILVGLIGGIVAVGFGQSQPAAPTGGTPNTFKRNLVSLGYFVSGAGANPGTAAFTVPVRLDRTKEKLGLAYALVYIIVSLCTIATWLYASEVASNEIRNMATVSIGLFVSIVTSFFRP